MISRVQVGKQSAARPERQQPAPATAEPATELPAPVSRVELFTQYSGSSSGPPRMTAAGWTPKRRRRWNLDSVTILTEAGFTPVPPHPKPQDRCARRRLLNPKSPRRKSRPGMRRFSPRRTSKSRWPARSKPCGTDDDPPTRRLCIRQLRRRELLQNLCNPRETSSNFNAKRWT